MQLYLSVKTSILVLEAGNIMEFYFYNIEACIHVKALSLYMSSRLSKKLHENLFVAKQRISDHVVLQRSRKTKAILDNAAIARSLLRSKMQQFRERAIAEKPSGSGRAESVEKSIENLNQQPPTSDPTERIRQIGTRKPSLEAI